MRVRSPLEGKRGLRAGKLIAFAGAAGLLFCTGASAQREGLRGGDDGAAVSISEYRQMRDKAVERQRRVIYNNDGAEVFLFPSDREINPTNVLDLRTTALAGSQVDAIFYNAAEPSFGLVTHYSEVFDIRGYYEQRHRTENKVNASWPLIQQGKDSLATTVEFGRKNGMEVFLSKRMNDTHDSGRQRPGSPNPTFAPLKARHPEYLFGSYSDRPAYGPWSAVDYGRPEIRDLVFRYLEEVCQNYDIDGIELDFFRGPSVFKSVAGGGLATEAERGLVTDLIRRIREMTEREGMKRGRPILVAIRVPDSVDYSRKIGLDIERWLAEGLIDLFVPAGLFRLNAWDYSVALGRKYGVPVYPCLVDPTWHNWEGRNSIESYRARAMNAWRAGASGVYLFNMFTPDHPMLNEIGSVETLAGKDKRYFISVRGSAGSSDPGHYLVDGANAFSYTPVAPNAPVSLQRDAPVKLVLPVGDELEAAGPAGLEATATLRLWVPALENPGSVETRFNDHLLKNAQGSGEYVTYALPPGIVRAGDNELEIGLLSDQEQAFVWRGPGPTQDDQLRFTKIRVSAPEANSLRIQLQAEARGKASLGSYSIRSLRREAVPPGFDLAESGYAYPAGWIFPGLTPNGPLDEEPDADSVQITLPMADAKPGTYTIQVLAQNRPASGPYYMDSRILSFSIDEQGFVHAPCPLQDVQLDIQYRKPER